MAAVQQNWQKFGVDRSNIVLMGHSAGAQAELLPLDKTHGEINAQLGADPAYTASVEGFLSQLSPAFAERLR